MVPEKTSKRDLFLSFIFCLKNKSEGWRKVGEKGDSKGSSIEEGGEGGWYQYQLPEESLDGKVKFTFFGAEEGELV